MSSVSKGSGVTMPLHFSQESRDFTIVYWCLTASQEDVDSREMIVVSCVGFFKVHRMKGWLTPVKLGDSWDRQVNALHQTLLGGGS